MADAIARFDVPAERLGEAPPMSGETPARPALGSLLVKGGFITEDRLADALQEGTATGARLGEVVVSRGWATEDDVAKLLAEQWQLGYVERASIWFDASALARMSREQAQRLEALPTRVQDGRVVVAVAEPTEQRLAALREVIGDDTVVVVVPKSALDAGLASELLGGSRAHLPESAVEPTKEFVTSAAVPASAADTAPPTLQTVEAPAAAAPRPSASAGTIDGEPDASDVLGRLQQAAAEAAALQRRVGDLATRLDGLAGDLGSLVERMAGGPSADERATIGRLEEQLGQRTELTERLKAQLMDLTRTLEHLG